MPSSQACSLGNTVGYVMGSGRLRYCLMAQHMFLDYKQLEISSQSGDFANAHTYHLRDIFAKKKMLRV